MSVDRVSNDDIAVSLPDSDSSNILEKEAEAAVDNEEKEHNASQSNEEGNDFIALGLTALGVIASGVALTMSNGSKPSDHIGDTIIENVTGQDDIDGPKSSTNDVVESADHSIENEWVSLDS